MTRTQKFQIALLLSLGIVVSSWFSLPLYWRYVVEYSVMYHVPSANVFVDDKPTDCDFWHSPIGRKRCHYEKVVRAFPANGVAIGGSRSIIIGVNPETGYPRISYDCGSTWHGLQKDFDRKVTHVYFVVQDARGAWCGCPCDIVAL